MGAQAGPILRMLGAVLAAHGHAQDHGHLEDAGAHGLPLGHLVEYLVARAADKVRVHELYHRSAAAHGVAHRAAYDAGFADGSIEQAGMRKHVRQSAVHGEGAAPVPYVLAVGHQGGILVELVDQWLEDGVPDVEGLHLAYGLSGLIEGGTALARDLLHAGALLFGSQHAAFLVAEAVYLFVGEHQALHHHGIGGHVGVGAEFLVRGVAADVGHALLGLGQDLLELVVLGNARFHQVPAVGDDGIHGHPVVDLVLLAVGVLVGHAVAAEAVGKGVQQHGAVAALKDLKLPAHGVDDRQGIEAVHALGVHLVGGKARAQARQHVVGHGLALGLAAHAVAVVEDVEQDGQAAHVPAVIAPQGVELVHAGEVQRFQHGAAAQGAVADVAHHEALFVVALLVQRGAGGDGSAAAHDGVVGIHAERQEEGVHTAAQAHMEAGLAGEDLGECAVKDEADSQFLHAVGLAHLFNGSQGRAAQEALHYLEQFLVGQLLDGGQRLGQYLGMAPVGTELVIVGGHQVRLAHARGFLAYGQVGGAGISGLHAVIHLLGLDGGEHALKLAQDGDVAVDTQQLVVREVLPLLLHGLGIGVYGDVGKVDSAFGSDLVWAVV